MRKWTITNYIEKGPQLDPPFLLRSRHFFDRNRMANSGLLIFRSRPEYHFLFVLTDIPVAKQGGSTRTAVSQHHRRKWNHDVKRLCLLFCNFIRARYFRWMVISFSQGTLSEIVRKNVFLISCNDYKLVDQLKRIKKNNSQGVRFISYASCFTTKKRKIAWPAIRHSINQSSLFTGSYWFL